MKKGKDKIGIVFSGGGFASAYGAGVWKALQEAGVSPDYVIGASSGSFNAALVAQGTSPQKILELYSNMTPERMLKESFPTDDLFTFENLCRLINRIAHKGRYSTKPLYLYLAENFDVRRIYESNVGVFIVGCTTRFKACVKNKEEIAKEDFMKFVLSSAAFPIFQPVKFQGAKLMDGGFHNNCPTNELLKRVNDIGRIYVINQKKIGRYRKLNKDLTDGVEIINIIPSEPIQKVFDTNTESSKKSFDLGYRDAKKILFIKKAQSK